MSDPKRLRDTSDLYADLLRSARWDRPSAKARARTVGALGLSAGLLGALTAWKAVAIGLVALGVTAGVSMMSAPAPRPLDGAPFGPSHARDGIPPAPELTPSAMQRFLSEQSSS